MGGDEGLRVGGDEGPRVGGDEGRGDKGPRVGGEEGPRVGGESTHTLPPADIGCQESGLNAVCTCVCVCANFHFRSHQNSKLQPTSHIQFLDGRMCTRLNS